MAKNAPYGDGHRQGQVTKRSQVHNSHNDRLLSFPRPIGERVRACPRSIYRGVRGNAVHRSENG